MGARLDIAKFCFDCIKWITANIKVILSVIALISSSTYGLVTELDNQDKEVTINAMGSKLGELSEIAYTKEAPRETKPIIIREGCIQCLRQIKELKLKYHPE